MSASDIESADSVDRIETGTVRQLLERTLPWERIRGLQRAPKDPGRFAAYRQALQASVPWAEPVLLAIHEHLLVVAADGTAVVRGTCGHTFGDYRENWKLHALIRVRRSEEDFAELYPADHGFDPELCELREFVCPGCGTLLEVDAVPPGYPVIFEFLPDLATLYREWLGEKLDVDVSFEDRSEDLVAAWVAETTPGARGVPVDTQEE